MQLTDERSVRLPIGMAHMVILKDDSSSTIRYVVIKDQTAVVVTFTFAPGHMRLVRSTIEAIARTLNARLRPPGPIARIRHDVGSIDRRFSAAPNFDETLPGFTAPAGAWKVRT